MVGLGEEQEVNFISDGNREYPEGLKARKRPLVMFYLPLEAH
jgi:hypothetical protein